MGHWEAAGEVLGLPREGGKRERCGRMREGREAGGEREGREEEADRDQSKGGKVRQEQREEHEE